MEILGLQISDKMLENEFVQSLVNHFEKKGRLSMKQYEALQDNLGVAIDFYDFERMPDFNKIRTHKSETRLRQDFIDLRKMIFRNNFRSHKARNRCIRAVRSFLCNGPRYDLINNILYPTEYGYPNQKGWR